MGDRDRDRRRHGSERSSRRSSGHDGSRRPRSPSRPPAHATTTAKALPAVGPPAGVTVPRYSGPPPPPNAVVAGPATSPGASHRHGRGHKKHAAAERRVEEGHRPRQKRHRTSPAPKEATREPEAPAAAAPSSSEDSSSEDSKDEKVDDKKATVDEETQLAIVSRVDELGVKAMAFSRALTRAQQALKTSARIAREAAVSFESELENFVAAQRDINLAFNIE